MTGLYTALRISDILRIRVKYVRNDYLNIREKKTSKLRRVYLHPELIRLLFKSREGENRPITRAMAYLILNEVAALQKLFNHSSPEERLRYIGIEQDNVDLLIKN